MSFLSEELKRQFKAAGTNAIKVSKISQISASQIYKWYNGGQIYITCENLNKIAVTLSPDRSDHAKLLFAHLKDVIDGAAGSELIDIDIKTPGELRDTPSKKQMTEGEAALAFLQKQRIKNPDTDDLLIRVAKSLGAKI